MADQSTLSGLAATNAALHGNFAPGVTMAGQLAGLSPTEAAALGIGSLGLTQGPTSMVGPASTMAGSLLGGTVGRGLGGAFGSGLTAGLRGGDTDTVVNAIADSVGDSIISANPIGMGLNALSGALTGKGLTANTLGSYNSTLGTRTGGLLGAEPTTTMFDNVPAAFDSKFAGFGRTPTFMGVFAPNKGFISRADLAADIQEPSPVETADIVANPNYSEQSLADLSTPTDTAIVSPVADQDFAPSYSPNAFGSYDSFVGNDNYGTFSAPDAGFTTEGVTDVSAPSSDYGTYSGDSFGGLTAGGVGQGESSQGGPGGGDGGGKDGGDGMVICTELFSQGRMPANIYYADQKYGLWQSDDVKQGYYIWAKPVVKLMRKSQLTTNIVAFFATPWSEHMAYEMGVLHKDNLFGKALMTTFKPICRVIGAIINRDKFAAKGV